MKQAAKSTTREKSAKPDALSAAGSYGYALFDIGWRLAVSVVVFLAGGSWLDKRFGTDPLFSVLGFLLIIFSFVVIVRRILQNIPRSQGGLKND